MTFGRIPKISIHSPTRGRTPEYAKGLQIKLKLLERRGKHTSFEVPSPTTGWREEVAAEPTASGRGFRDPTHPQPNMRA